MTVFRLRFPTSDVQHWADRYSYADDSYVRAIGANAGRKGWYSRAEFLDVMFWKTKRTQALCALNTEASVVKATSVALSADDERLRMRALTSLHGVAVPTASVLLHIAHRDPYPIVDFRALWSLGLDAEPRRYSFAFWWAYTQACRALAADAGVTMRTFDRALWQYSRERQRQSPGVGEGLRKPASTALEALGERTSEVPRSSLPVPPPRAQAMPSQLDRRRRERPTRGEEEAMGPVEQAVRDTFRSGRADLETLSNRASFALTWDEKGIVVYLGKQRTPSRLEWSCLEGVPGHLRGQGWMLAGGMNKVTGEPGTLDEHLKKCVKVNTSRWVVRVLRDAGVVEARTDPVEIRLTPRFDG